MEWLIGCVLVITIVAVYVPIVLIRLGNKILKTVDQIEINTRKQ